MDTQKKVFIVEDDEFLRSIAVKRLEKEGYTLAVATDAPSAPDLIFANQPDVILLDLLLPGGSGFEVLEKVRANDLFKKTPIIVFSNLGQVEDLEKAKGLGANDFLVKANFTLDDVAAKVKTYLG